MRGAATFFLLAGTVVIATNLMSGESAARSIRRGIIPVMIGGFVLFAVRRRAEPPRAPLQPPRDERPEGGGARPDDGDGA
jgi:hypothetical protein